MAEPSGNSKTNSLSRIIEVDPQCADALALLREAAIEARALYPELFAHDAPWPGNPPTAGRGVYLVAYTDGKPVACGSLRSIDAETVEVHRLFVTAAARRRGLARAMLLELERRAAALDYVVMRLETGNRQLAAIALYEILGFKRTAPFGRYAHDPLSVCFEKTVSPARGG